MKTLAIDFGEKNVGVAISDDKGVVAAPLLIIKRKNDDQVIDEIKNLANKHLIRQIIVGVPKSIYGNPTQQEARCVNFAEKLKPFVHVPVEAWDESLSSKQVIFKSKDLDAKAAAMFLQEYLDSKNN
jgi:putative Holliday junction resolvase